MLVASWLKEGEKGSERQKQQEMFYPLDLCCWARLRRMERTQALGPSPSVLIGMQAGSCDERGGTRTSADSPNCDVGVPGLS